MSPLQHPAALFLFTQVCCMAMWIPLVPGYRVMHMNTMHHHDVTDCCYSSVTSVSLLLCFSNLNIKMVIVVGITGQAGLH